MPLTGSDVSVCMCMCVNASARESVGVCLAYKNDVK